jgi:curved DNA-binding protein CbpA
MYDKPELPMAPDHYPALALNLDATKLDIQQAYGKFALNYHPNKHAPGEMVDAIEFRKININQFGHLDVPLTHLRQVQEAYEVLINLEQREAFEYDFPNIYEQWQK